MALDETCTGIRAADGKSAQGTEVAVGEGVVIEQTETEKRAELARRVPGELVVILPAPLVVAGGSDKVPVQPEGSGARLIGSPGTGLVEEILDADVDTIGGDDVVLKSRSAGPIGIAGVGIIDRRRRAGEIAELHSGGGHLRRLA